MAIRKATPADGRFIHEAHMVSIREVCSKDHSPEEIAAWGGRDYNPEKWTDAITKGHVWVVEIDNKIEGFGYIHFYFTRSANFAHVQGLYLTPKALGKGFGKEIASLLIGEAKIQNIERINLESTITAHGFYKKLGFQDTGPLVTREIAGQPVRCYPMTLLLSQ